MKKIIPIILIIFLTGCNAQYNLMINDEGYTEEILLISENENDSRIISQYQKPVEKYYDSADSSETLEKVDEIDYYDMNKYTENNFYNLKLTTDFTKNDYIKSNIASHSVSIFKTYRDGGVYQLFAGSYFKCFEMNNGINNLVIGVTLSDDYEVVESNADKINNNMFIWNIDKYNYKNKSVHFYYQKKEDSSNSSSDDSSSDKSEVVNSNSSYSIYIFCGILVIIILVGYKLFINMRDKNNKLDD